MYAFIYEDKCSTHFHQYSECIQKGNYLSWTSWKMRSGFEVPGVLQELSYLLLLGIFFNIILILVEGRIFRVCWSLVNKSKKTNSRRTSGQSAVGDDEDVLKEAQRVHQLVTTKGKRPIYF